MADDIDCPLTRSTARELLENAVPTFATDDNWLSENPRNISLRDFWDRANNESLLRFCDGQSGSQPEPNGRMLAGRSRMRLHTAELRKETLQTHADAQSRTSTPYISFTTSADDLHELAEQYWAHAEHNVRSDLTVVVVDPLQRLRLGLPMINYADALEQYQVPDKGNNRRNLHTNHYLCLWEVTPEEVVGRWSWEELRKNKNWYDEIILPAVQAFRARQSEGVSDGDEGIENEPDTRDYCDFGETRAEGYGDFYYVSSDDDETRCANNWAEQSWKEYEDNLW